MAGLIAFSAAVRLGPALDAGAEGTAHVEDAEFVACAVDVSPQQEARLGLCCVKNNHWLAASCFWAAGHRLAK